MKLRQARPMNHRRSSPATRLHTASLNILARALPETMALLNDNWQAVVLVAEALTKGDRFSQALLDRIVAHGQL